MKVGIYTLGCKVNAYESEYVVDLLRKHNYDICDFNDICDIYIINTCTVTNTSDIKSKKIIRQARRRNKDALIIAFGCFTQANPKLDMDEIDILLGNKDKSKIIDYIEEYFKNKNKLIKVYNDLGTNFEDMYIENFGTRTRAFVKIQDGCENYCSYCIIPFVRGKCRSKEFDKTIKEITSLVNNGFYEVVLTGIHTGNYGVDINTNLCSLIKEIVKIKGLKRLRISSIEITELNDEILEVIKDNNIVVNHLHVPIQAASDKVLEIMNRKYNLQHFKDKIKYIKEIKKDISITTDIIVGHPGEDDVTFENSINDIKEIGFSKLHVFPYSRREGTKSSSMEQIDERTKKERTKKLLMLSRELEISYMKSFLNKELEVLVEVNKDNYSVGHTTNYLQVKINEPIKHNKFVNVRITDIDYPYCIGEIINK
ncbi:MAG: tRNA (N(6)-L-threonylcarbamoyladenosine(37)-C(2))-methylthiotransferase MtaB [Bacilli bacterium]|nr:tRNA (N(6)-L-threonylcarbamoyladenosine(37)-C(2))-methylthiotransferase MtaB [Bacilli bacterium]